jgi:hypothetical protein
MKTEGHEQHEIEPAGVLGLVFVGGAVLQIVGVAKRHEGHRLVATSDPWYHGEYLVRDDGRCRPYLDELYERRWNAGSHHPGVRHRLDFLQGYGFKVADGNTWWSRIASAPWDNNFYVSADAFYNDGQTLMIRPDSPMSGRPENHKVGASAPRRLQRARMTLALLALLACRLFLSLAARATSFASAGTVKTSDVGSSIASIAIGVAESPAANETTTSKHSKVVRMGT